MMKTKLKVIDARGKIIARVSERGMENHATVTVAYNQTSGSVTVRCDGEPVTVSGSVRGSLTTFGNVNVHRVRVGGNLSLIN